ncbi:MAG TPA: LamG-like jellyroll fold domain-containing protein [Acidothermaceae bacterium]|nr:LamG-like jellyroll fold domain-containing protein [Acidothermaceae bacterium]
MQTWQDQSGNGNNASQSGAAEPPYFIAKMNGMPALQGDGATYSMATSTFTLGASASLFAAVQATAATQGLYSRLLEHLYSSTYYLGVDSTGTKYKLIVNNGTSPYGAAQGGTVATANQIVSGVYSSPTGTVYVNGQSAGSDSFTAPSPPLNHIMSIMKDVNPMFGDYWKGYFGEAIVYNRALTSGELIQVHRYLGARYGVSVP